MIAGRRNFLRRLTQGVHSVTRVRLDHGKEVGFEDGAEYRADATGHCDMRPQHADLLRRSNLGAIASYGFSRARRPDDVTCPACRFTPWGMPAACPRCGAPLERQSP